MSAALALPFRDRWFVMQGGDTLNVNHHMAVEAQWYGLDFAKVGGPSGRELARGTAPQCADFYGWDAEVVAPLESTIVAAEDGWPDNSLGTFDREHPLGNHVVLQSGERYFWLAHLRLGSLTVRVGQRVTTGTVIGSCGNSGNSDFPHIHCHATRSPVFGEGRGENLVFDAVDIEMTGRRFTNVNWPLIRGLFVSNHLDPEA